MNLQYVAGIIDGEGYVSIDRNDAYSACLVGKVVVQMASPTLPKMLKRAFGGNYRTYKRINPRQSDAHSWCLNGAQSVSLLKKLLPFLILKKKQAALVIKLYEARAKRKSKTHPTPLEKRYQERLYVAAKKLVTRKGPRR